MSPSRADSPSKFKTLHELKQLVAKHDSKDLPRLLIDAYELNYGAQSESSEESRKDSRNCIRYLEGLKVKLQPEDASKLLYRYVKQQKRARPAIFIMLNRHGAKLTPANATKLICHHVENNRFCPDTIKHLERFGGQLSPSNASKILLRRAEPLNEYSLVAVDINFLEERGALLDETFLLKYVDNSKELKNVFLMERLLARFVSTDRHREAWNLAIEAYDRWVDCNGEQWARNVGSEFLGHGLLRLFHKSVNKHRIARKEINLNKSILESTTAKLKLLSEPYDCIGKCIPYTFRQWISESLKARDPSIEWIQVSKARHKFQVRKDVLSFWFNSLPDTAKALSFDENNAITEKSFVKIFGTYVTTGVYNHAGIKDIERDLDAAESLKIKPLVQRIWREYDKYSELS